MVPNLPIMNHNHFLLRCLELAERGRGTTHTNPMVGCVIVNSDGEIVTEGWHKTFGEKHAEVDAIAKLATCNLQPATLTLYVNLEPCCTHGKQPPCTDEIIKSGIKTVVFGARDSSNCGADVLRNAGITVIGPVMEPIYKRFNRGFFSLIEKNRPWVTIKKAMRADGSVDGKITNTDQDAWAHKRLRATHDAILVGAKTIINDDPQLTIRLHTNQPINQSTNQPHRIILDPHSQIPPTAKILTDEHRDRTIVINEKMAISDLLNHLKEKGISSLLVEGGPSVWKSFEDAKMFDEMVVLSGNS